MGADVSGTREKMNHSKPRILHLTIKFRWFKEIAEGRKPREFREIKDYWTKRLCNPDGTAKVFDQIHIRNSYSKDKPFMRLRWNGWEIQTYGGNDCYALDATDIIEIRNYSDYNPQ
jgi:hypothetical protein